MDEEFRDCWWDGYEVSQTGVVRSKKGFTTIVLKYRDRPKRHQVQLCVRGQMKLFYVDELVLEAWDRFRKPKEEVGYRDGNSTNHVLSNLFWRPGRSQREKRIDSLLVKIARFRQEIAAREQHIKQLDQMSDSDFE